MVVASWLVGWLLRSTEGTKTRRHMWIMYISGDLGTPRVGFSRSRRPAFSFQCFIALAAFRRRGSRDGQVCHSDIRSYARSPPAFHQNRARVRAQAALFFQVGYVGYLFYVGFEMEHRKLVGLN